MNRLLSHIIFVLLAAACLSAHAVEERHDTIYFYETWEQILYDEPVEMIVDPFIDVYSYALDFLTYEKILNDKINKQYIAAHVGDGYWFINSNYLYKNFEVDLNYLSHYVPLYFNDKIAYTLSVANVGFMDDVSVDDESDVIDYYYIDFVNYKVRRVNPTVLSELLRDYHDLLMRYESMKDYKKRNIIEDYFFKYIKRATDDFMHPDILDLVKDDADAFIN